MSIKASSPWWRDAVIYQVYIRSFADGNGDGVGDIAGIRSRLPHLRDLGVDALWITPWYVSPQVDAGYDVADFRGIDPLFGTIREAEELIEDAHDIGLRLIIDIVPNHTSDQHSWFQQALASDAGGVERSRYHFRSGRGPQGAEPPNNWRSRFGGPAWTRVTDRDGKPGQWYLHLYAPEQPDLNWDQPEVRKEFESILRFWFERGVDGFRIDVAYGLAKDSSLPDFVDSQYADGEHPFQDRDEVHEIYGEWRRIADTYPGERIFVAEAWVDKPHRLANYVRSGRLHTAFNFVYLRCPWDPDQLRAVIDGTISSLTEVGAPPTWVLSNHDVVRHVSRYARPPRPWGPNEQPDDSPVDLALGTKRARAAALLMLALPGGAYIYQGEELGLPEVEDLPENSLEDPVWERSGHRHRGRDGCRVPLPWKGESSPFGFSVDDGNPWLPQPTWMRHYSVEAETGRADSMLELYREALQIRRSHEALGDGSMRWTSTPEGVLSFQRSPDFACVVNLSAEVQELPKHKQILLASSHLDEGGLPSDTAIWLEI